MFIDLYKSTSTFHIDNTQRCYLGGQLTRFRNKLRVALKSLPVSSWWMSSEKLGSSPHQKSQSSRRPCLWLRLHTQHIRLKTTAEAAEDGVLLGDREQDGRRGRTLPHVPLPFYPCQISLWEREIVLASVSKAVRSPTLKRHTFGSTWMS